MACEAVVVKLRGRLGETGGERAYKENVMMKDGEPRKSKRKSKGIFSEVEGRRRRD